jgi:hypothetical protein
MTEAEYEVRVSGTLADADLADVGAVTLATTRVDTVLYGVADQSALYSLLARLRGLGLEVVEVRRVSHPPMTAVPEQPGEPEQSEQSEQPEQPEQQEQPEKQDSE